MARTIRNRTAAWGLSTSIGVFIGSFLSSDLKRNATSHTTPRIRVHAGRNSSHRHFRLSGRTREEGALRDTPHEHDRR